MNESQSNMERLIEQIAFFNGMMLLAGLGFFIFVLWCLYVYVTSRRDWFEEDIRIREAEKRYNLAKAEQIRLECIALKDRLEKSGIGTKKEEFL